MTLRAATLDDIENLISIAQSAYGSRDYTAARAWLRDIIPNPNFHILLGQRTLFIGTLAHLPWEVEPKAVALFLTARSDIRRPALEPLHTLRAFANWAKSKGAPTLEAGSGSVYKIEPLLRRLGLPIERLEHFRVRLT